MSTGVRKCSPDCPHCGGSARSLTFKYRPDSEVQDPPLGGPWPTQQSDSVLCQGLSEHCTAGTSESLHNRPPYSVVTVLVYSQRTFLLAFFLPQTKQSNFNRTIKQ